MAYYVSYHLPIDCTLPPVNKHRLLEIRQYSKQYLKYHRGARRKSLTEAFGYCKFTEIKRGNIERWLSWAFFFKYDDTTRSQLPPEQVKWRDELIADTITDFECELNHKFPPGNNSKLVNMSNIAENPKLVTTYHPLTMYLFIHLGPKQLSNFIFHYIFGFEVQWIRGLKIWSKMTTNKLDINHFEPIIYFGGVSAGNPGQALLLMFKLQRKWGNTRNLFVVELPWSEMSIHHFIPFSNQNYVTNKVALSMDEMTDILIHIEQRMLHRNGIVDDLHSLGIYRRLKCQWNLMGESYGSCMCSAIYQRIKTRNLGVIPRLILIDSPALCMTDPSASKLMGMIERVWWKRIFQMAVGEEMMIATMGARYFHWYEYCLYPHELVNDGCRMGHIIVSGTKDHLIPFGSIQHGVEDANLLCQDEGKRIRHVVMDGVPHGIFLVHPRYQDAMIDLL